MVPLRPKLRVVGRCTVLHVVVQLCRLHLLTSAQCIKHIFPIQGHVVVVEQENVGQFAKGRHPFELTRGQESRKGQVMGFDMGIQLHNQLARHGRARWRVVDQTLGVGGCWPQQACHQQGAKRTNHGHKCFGISRSREPSISQNPAPIAKKCRAALL